MKIVRKGYGVNSYPTLVFNKPTFKVKVNAKRYFYFVDALRYIDLHKFVIFSAIWMCVIFLFSNQVALDSAQLSNNLSDTLSNITFFNLLFKILPIRKCAHFLLYFVLSFFVFFALKQLDSDFISFKTISICFIYALTDEFHQFFIDGRSAQFYDVLIDTAGAGVCLFIIYIAFALYNKFSD